MRTAAGRFVVRVPLSVDARESHIIDQRLLVRGKLRNAVLGRLLANVDQMSRDPRWRAAKLAAGAERAGLERALRQEFIAPEILTQVKNWIHGNTGKPRFRPPTAVNVCWGNDNQAGLRFQGQRIVWPCRSRRKNLALKLRWRAGSTAWRRHLEGRRVVRVGIQREHIRDRDRYFALICLAGTPYRNPTYLRSVVDGTAGLDVGPSLLAVVGERSSEVIPLAPPALVEQRRHNAARQRRRQRALERSRRAMNPDCYDHQGHCIKGKRPRKRSKRGRRLQGRIASENRRQRLHRRQDQTWVARRVMQNGSRLAFEQINYRSWERSHYGKRMAFTAPGTLISRIAREAQRLGGAVIPLDTRRLALSQHCLCGARRKKRLSQRTHSCEACGLGPLHRDLFAAFLARLVGQTRITDLRRGPFAGMAGIWGEAAELCAAAPGPAPLQSSSQSAWVQAGIARLAGESAAQTPAQSATPHSDAGRGRTGKAVRATDLASFDDAEDWKVDAPHKLSDSKVRSTDAKTRSVRSSRRAE